ncbi:MAG: HD domain-containing protein [Thermodesulfobacteriota bacterium]|nr:MAG: HD domain-containing protein [Thermodesulfobacteriota bacterium]
MKKTFIKSIKERDSVQDAFLVTKKETGISKSGKPYLNMKLMDSTGEMEARVWDDAEELSRGFKKDDIVIIKGFAVAYQGGVQLNVSAVKAAPEEKYQLRDFLPSSGKTHEELSSGLASVIAGIKDRHIKALIESIFSDPEIRGAFLMAPAAKSMHHPYLGGLAEHVLSICGLVEKVAGHYGECVNKDLLTAGALLHDIGKIWELSYQRSFDYTDEGRLIGHITMGTDLIERKAGAIPGFPRELSMLLKHLVLSHHGQLEFGSPKRPKTIEAIILSYLDDLDAKVSTVKGLIEDKGDGSNWTSYQRLFERYIYKGGTPAGGQDERAADRADRTDDGGEDGKGNLNLFK